MTEIFKSVAAPWDAPANCAETETAKDENATRFRRDVPFRHVIAVVAGNGLEFYDFLTYTIFAVYISKAFFPQSHSGFALILTFVTAWMGFFARPLGAIVLGGLGDRIGRKPAMLLSFAMMGAGMFGVALTPTYAQIGVAAPLLIVLFRLVQGFALGGEVGPTTAYLIEAAPAERRGFYGSMQYVSQEIAVLAASLVGVVLAACLSPDEIQSWGWRLAFFIGLLIVPFGLLVRSGLPETLHAADDAALAPDATTGMLATAPQFRSYGRVILLGFVMLASATIGAYVTDYMVTYSLDTLHLKAGIAFGVTVVTSLCAMCVVPVSGLLSDRFGRRPVMLIPGTVGVCLIIPVFWVITHFPSARNLYVMMGGLSSVFALAQTPVIIMLTEQMPPQIRSGGLATVYAFSISIFGGSTQFVITVLLKATGNAMMLAYYWTGAAVLGLTAMALMPESAPRKLAARMASKANLHRT